MRYILNVSMIIFRTLAFSQEKMNLLDYATNYVEYEKDDVQIINGLLYTNCYFNPKLLSGDIKVLTIIIQENFTQKNIMKMGN